MAARASGPSPVGAPRRCRRDGHARPAARRRARYVADGLNTYEISALTNRSAGTVRTALKQAGIELRARGGNHEVRFPQLRDEAFVVDALVARGLTFTELANEVGCAVSSVRRAVRRTPVREALIAVGHQLPPHAPALEADPPAWATLEGRRERARQVRHAKWQRERSLAAHPANATRFVAPR